MHFVKTIAATLLLLLVTACGVVPPAPGNVEHVVLIWLKQPGNELTKARMVSTARTFPGQIPGLLSLSIGDALTNDRDVVDDSFDLALIMRFSDSKALAAYETHPVHVAAKQDVLLPNAARVVVYDALLR